MSPADPLEGLFGDGPLPENPLDEMLREIKRERYAGPGGPWLKLADMAGDALALCRRMREGEEPEA